jgi:hypothetical protein
MNHAPTVLRRARRAAAAAALLLVAAGSPARAAVDEQTAWGAWFGNTRFNERWGLLSDVQLRSVDDRAGLQTSILRAGASYLIDERHTATLGYGWFGTHNNPGEDLVEHRVWQQYLVTGSFAGAALQHRFRLEQRFVEPRPGADRLFSQRARYFIRAVKPIGGGSGTFRRGPFVALQNELFLTVQHATNTNQRLFDQNRAYAALGWRFDRRFDVEVGYLNQHVQRRAGELSNHVLQVAFYSRLP